MPGRPDYGHRCRDWDFMFITANDPEFMCCTCNHGPMAIEAVEDAKERLRRRYDVLAKDPAR